MVVEISVQGNILAIFIASFEKMQSFVRKRLQN